MDDILKDNRFTKLVNDPRYRQIPKKERKVKIDERFHSMFVNDKFKVKYTVDKRGRPVNQSSSENLKKYYDLSSEESDSSDEEASDKEDARESVKEDDEKHESFGAYVLRRKSLSDEEVTQSSKDIKEVSDDNEKDESKLTKNAALIRGELTKDVRKKLRDLEVDYARGEGVLFSDSSSEEESSEEEEELEHGWGELDADAETTDEATARLAVCNMDWDNIKASDLFVLFNSFLPPGGLVRNVTIYPSEFGLKRIQEEELRGPIELTETKKENDDGSSDDDENEEGSKYHMEKLRQYQLNRLKYFYAVVTFDSPTTANKIYTDCDGIEYESSAAKLDLRFIPDDVTFEQESHDECLELPDVSRYKPRLFTTTALQQAKVELTWDAANPHRSEVLKGAAEGHVLDEDLKNYLAFSSEEEESEIEEPKHEEEEPNNVDPISKYKALLQEIESNDNKKKNREMEMEVTWGLGLKEKTEQLVKKKLTKGDKLTPFEELVEKRKEKKKARKLEKKKKFEKPKDSADENSEAYSSDDIPSDIDMNDPYFAEELNDPEFKTPKKTKKNKKNKNDTVDSDLEKEELRKRAELELLLDDDDGKQHFSLKKIQDAENETKSKRKRKLKEKLKNKSEAKETVQDFDIDVNDKRFSALFTSHHFNIDPTDPNFKKTKAMDKLIQEKLKRRPVETKEDPRESKKSKTDAAMSVLIKSLKRKTQNINSK